MMKMKDIAETLKRPFEDFFHRQASGGLVLLGAVVLALLLANSPLSHLYFEFWETEISIGLPYFSLDQSLHHWINDGLMAIFFFVVGLEIKREFLAGELATARKAWLPAAAALGGMLVPALIFRALNPAPPAVAGWGIPMATDIAFALGVIALLGKRISRSLAIFLTALAIVDDLGAVLVIALFYAGDISMVALFWAGGFFLLLVLANRAGVRAPYFYSLVGFCLWAALFKSGVHASIAGVLIGSTIPVRPRYDHGTFLSRVEELVQGYRAKETREGPFLHEDRLATLLALEHVCHESMSPLQRMEHEMNFWVIFGVMPIFALANAGLTLDWQGLQAAVGQPVTLGVALGLLVGKPLGIFGFTWLAVKMKVCDLPSRAGWRDILGVGFLAGIGFTMSLFIAYIAFSDPGLVGQAKIGILGASVVSGVVGYLVLSRKRNSSEGH